MWKHRLTYSYKNRYREVVPSLITQDFISVLVYSIFTETESANWDF